MHRELLAHCLATWRQRIVAVPWQCRRPPDVSTQLSERRVKRCARVARRRVDARVERVRALYYAAICVRGRGFLASRGRDADLPFAAPRAALAPAFGLSPRPGTRSCSLGLRVPTKCRDCRGRAVIPIARWAALLTF